MKECPQCRHRATDEDFKEVPLKGYDATVTVNVTFEVKATTKAHDRADAAKRLANLADESVREMLDEAQIEWMDTSVDRLAPDEVGPRPWTGEELRSRELGHEVRKGS